MTEHMGSLTLWHWLGLATILVILEVLLGSNFFLLWLAIAAASVGVFVAIIPNLTWEYQLLIFSLEAVACIFLWNKYLKQQPRTSDEPNLNRRNEQYIGRTFTLIEPVVNGRGKIKVDDSFWTVSCEQDLPTPTKVTVVKVDGVVLHVKSTTESNQ